MSHQHMEAIGNTNVIPNTLLRTSCQHQPNELTNTHQLMEVIPMESNYICLDKQQAVIVLTGLILNLITFVLIVLSTIRNCSK